MSCNETIAVLTHNVSHFKYSLIKGLFNMVMLSHAAFYTCYKADIIQELNSHHNSRHAYFELNSTKFSWF